MSVMVASFLLQTVPVVTTARIPQIVTTTTTTSMPRDADRYRIPPEMRAMTTRAITPYVVDVEVKAGDILIWSGSLRIGAPRSAAFQRTLNEYPPAQCTGPKAAPYPNSRDSFRVELRAIEAENAPSRQSFTISWERPTEDCATGQVQRTVELAGSLQLQPGASATVQGDAGLIVRFTRR